MVSPFFFSVFHGFFPLRKAHNLKLCGRCSCQISTLPLVDGMWRSWRSSKDISIGFAFSVFCAWFQLQTYYPWPFMKPVPACTCLWQLNISNFLPRFKSSQNCVMFLKKNYLLGINHKPNHNMNHFRRFQQETALQPFKPAPLRSCRCPCGPRLDTQPSQNSVWKWMGFYSELGTKWPWSRVRT